ncbi:uncharacterized protein LOC111637735 [Centruroides sculpturatus]|uniref:uncharacterized protein LOC111637735 n=1 Tax=Centruroides sculpturatus TaxID=218467 RepID=UPI000C6E247A|nr:uncharacterized protein LOC111637735 [Centruroides sculpturatus]
MKRKDDFSNAKSKEVSLNTNEELTLEDDLFSAECEGSDGANWNNIMFGVHRKKETEHLKQHKLLGNNHKLNVLMFGLDSMSRLHYMRKLPKTYNYLINQLDAVILKGYNIVGDGTPQALIPILTGFTERELPETRKRMSNANYVNIYPFIWKNFSQHGYVTAFGEDLPSTGIFTYRLKGFNDLPTDHYLRNFYVEIDKILRKQSPYCLGSIPRHQLMLRWLREFFDVYYDIPKFIFGFHGELSHDDYNLVGYADEDIYDFIKSLNEDGILNNTLLILMSDHGHRFASIRETQQGKLEERLPFFSIVVPPWFQHVYPIAFKNLKANTDKLATPFDIYSTLMTVLHPSVPKVGDIQRRSISLFSEIPLERTCANADIEAHWCTCLEWQDISVKDRYAIKAGQAVIDFINNYTNQFSTLCIQLVLDKITRAEKLSPNQALLKFKKNADKDGFVGDFSDNTKVSEVIYQIQLVAFPSKAKYEASVKFNIETKTFNVQEREISRINLYGNQPHCVYDTHPNLRKYCYCKIQIAEK